MTSIYNRGFDADNRNEFVGNMTIERIVEATFEENEKEEERMKQPQTFLKRCFEEDRFVLLIQGKNPMDVD